MNLEQLIRVIVTAKQATYVGNGRVAEPSRQGSHDLVWSEGDWSYRDSYFGGTDFIGQECLWRQEKPVWSMAYYGYVLRDDLIDAARAGATIKAALSAMYADGRFLGGWHWSGPHGDYRDQNTGDSARFKGRETISVAGETAYALDYFGGLTRA